MNKKHKASISLYDAGGGIILFIVLGIPVGIILDYLLNFAVLTLTLRAIHHTEKTTLGRRLFYSLIATIVGLTIDVIYLVIRQAFTHEDFIATAPKWLGSPTIAFALLPIPLVLIFLANWILSSTFLKLERKYALIVGLTMAIFTTPWVLAFIHMT